MKNANDTPEAAEANDLASASPSVHGDNQFRLMIEAVRDYGIFMLDPQGHVVNWNEGAERIKGYTADEIIGKHFSTFYPEEALARDWPAYELEAAAREGRFEDEGWRLRKDGSRFWANVVITALRAPDGRLVGYTKVTRDLTERREHEEALRQSERHLEKANAELSRKNSDLQDFAYVASHDLQEPLRKVRTFASMLENEYHDSLDDMGRLYIERICASAERMSSLIKGLLDFSRVSTHVRPYQRVNLTEVVDAVTVDLQILMEEAQGRIERDALPTIAADATQMRQLFQNLIGNALKFRRPGTPPVVRIRREATSGSTASRVCTLTVEDNGIGFDEVYLDRIFAPFLRLHTRDAYEGNGLGLAICKRIVDRHGGAISARSRPGLGATFTIQLPLGQPAQQASE